MKKVSLYGSVYSSGKRVVLAGLLLACSCVLGWVSAARAALPGETPEQIDRRMAWWREAKFGMFIHWGIYSVPAGEWKGKQMRSGAEWIMNRLQIPVEEYEQFQKQFNPVKFDAAEWVSLAKRAGMKYIVITSKHHDGFCMFDSKLTDYDIMGTPFKRDVLKELAEECRKQGVRLCFYHSIMDWHHPDARGERFPRYEKYMRGQLRELLTNYGPIGVLWFDGEWIKEWDREKGRKLEAYVRSLQPDLIVNNRVGKRKQGDGDFGTPEQFIPATGLPGMDWETCMTMNHTWGYSKLDHDWKSYEDLLHKLVDIVSKGGNFLLNVGPTAEGVIPQPSVERLEAMGRWLAVNGESIYGTQASPFKRLNFGRCTRKPGVLYLHVFDWPEDGVLKVPGLLNEVKAAYLLADPQQRLLKVNRCGESVEITLPDKAPDPVDTVVVLKIEGEPNVVEPAIEQDAQGKLTLPAREAVTHGQHIRYERGDGKDNIGFWTEPQDWVEWVVRVKQPGSFDVEVTYACPKPGGSRYRLEIADQKLEATVKATGGWTSFQSEKLGQIKLPEGRHHLAVRAVELKGEGVMNLKSIVLRPVEQ